MADGKALKKTFAVAHKNAKALWSKPSLCPTASGALLSTCTFSAQRPAGEQQALWAAGMQGPRIILGWKTLGSHYLKPLERHGGCREGETLCNFPTGVLPTIPRFLSLPFSGGKINRPRSAKRLFNGLQITTEDGLAWKHGTSPAHPPHQQ